ncbi:MAG: AAA family ATPase [Sulfurovum sp.]|nr:AAA family ATPase [Sulfurovum sp.]
MQEEEKDHFIKNIEIENFKCFKEFKAEGFGRINLIGGKNNVGKTAFMEACYINSGSFDIKHFIKHMNSIKFMRENLNILSGSIIDDTRKFVELHNGINLQSNINSCSFDIKEKDGIKEYLFEFNNKHIKVNANDFSFDYESKKNNNFIDNFGLSNDEIITAYGYIQKRDEENYLNSILNKFDSRIEAFKIIEDKPQCKIDSKYIEITELGDGARHIVSIITKLYRSENGNLYIDELDNGIHYTMLDELWEIVLDVSKKLNVQVFATTHSKECIESYARVAKRLEDEEITYTILSKLDNGEIRAGVYTSSMLINTIDQEHEVRGW